MKAKSIILSAIFFFALNTGCFDSSGSDNNSGSPCHETADGVFAKLEINRDVFSNTPAIKDDEINAIFSQYYDPCTVLSDLQPAEVKCNSYTLAWDGSLFKYAEPLNAVGFLQADATYAYSVTASTGVPALSVSIDFPGTEPMVTSPAFWGTASLNGFTVEWDDAEGSGIVHITLVDKNVKFLYRETADTGSCTFSSSDLSGFAAGLGDILLQKYSYKYIDAEGYDSRSTVYARHRCHTVIIFE